MYGKTKQKISSNVLEYLLHRDFEIPLSYTWTLQYSSNQHVRNVYSSKHHTLMPYNLQKFVSFPRRRRFASSALRFDSFICACVRFDQERERERK